MDRSDFESILDYVCKRLTADVRASDVHHKPAVFEDFVRLCLLEELAARGHAGVVKPVVQGFPDIVAGRFGVEVKATESDNWRCIANSISEGNRASEVQEIFLVYGKMGGTPEVRWGDYGKSIVHVRTSHVPRFEVEIDSDRSLFAQIGISYDEFQVLPMEKKMPFIRNYARGRLGPGERLWWLEDREIDDQEHSMSLAVKVYMDLSPKEKRQMRAESALMCPQIVGGSRQKRKYIDATLYLMTYRGVLCPQARDLFSAGSVAGAARGGHYLSRALVDIQSEMRIASEHLEQGLFVEYWGGAPPENGRERLLVWLDMADKVATNWTPSDHLFLEEQGRH